jgi:DNA polymerase-4
VEQLTPVLGQRQAEHIRNLALGIDPRSVAVDSAEKSIGRSQTFNTDLTEMSDMNRELLRMATDVASRARQHGFVAHTVTVTVRFGDWTTITRSHTLTDASNATRVVAAEARKLLASVSGTEQGVRLLGVRLENLIGEGDLAFLWDDTSDGREIDVVVDAVATKFGADTVRAASLIRSPRD